MPSGSTRRANQLDRALSTTDGGAADWTSAAWRDSAVAWLDEQLAATGVQRIGEVSQPHVRPWGTVLTTPTTQGPVWLKAPGPETAFEVALYQLLARLTPEWILPPIAVDVERGWIVLPDGGTPLGERLDEVELVEALVAVLPQYGQLQRDLIPHVDELLSIGVTDMRAEVMPARFDEALAAVERYVRAYGDAAGRETVRRTAAMRETVHAWCARLARALVLPSLDHNDLHPWNVFLTGEAGDARTGRARFYDWGDSVVAHPFASMLLGVGFLHHRLGVGPGDRVVRRTRDAYLEVFSDLAPHAELVQELELACRVGKIARVLTWDRALRAQGYHAAGRFATAPLEGLEALLADSWMRSV